MLDYKKVTYKISYIYNKFFKIHRKLYAFILVMTFITTLLSLIEPILNEYLIDDIIGLNKYEDLPSIILLYIFICIINFMILYVVQKKNIHISTKSSYDIKKSIIERIQGDKVEISSQERSDVLVTVTQDVDVISNFFNNTLITTMLHVGYIIVLAIYLMRYSILLTFLIFINAIIQIIISLFFIKDLRDNYYDLKRNSEREMSFLNSTLINIKLIRAFVYEKRNVDKFSNIFQNFRFLTWRNFELVYRQSFLIGLSNIVGTCISIIIGSLLVRKNAITVGILFNFLSLSGNIKGSLEYLVSLNTSFNQFMVSLNRVYKTIRYDQKPKLENENKQIEIEKLELKDITYNVGKRYILKQASIEFIKGQYYLLTGVNGIGKSTLVNILCRFYPISEGNIIVNDDKKITFDDYHWNEKISIAFQQKLFLEDTIKENLIIGNNQVSDEKLMKILSLVKCNEFIDNLEHGFSSNMDDCNSKYSGGELQKLNIARTLLKDADIYIFDEVFANVESDSKLDIFNNIVYYLKDKIVIFISHDEEILRNVTESIYMIKDTRIIPLIS